MLDGYDPSKVFKTKTLLQYESKETDEINKDV